MEIDLKKVIDYSRDSLQSRALMRSIMHDMYPNETREMNVLLDVYESGIPRKIKKEGSITEENYKQYVQKIIDDYGLQHRYVEEALDKWIEICLGEGVSSNIHSAFIQKSKTEKNHSNPIKNIKVSELSCKVVGEMNDYEIKPAGKGLIEISKFLGFDREKTVIPTEIKGKKVIGIGINAFKKCNGIRELIVPEGIEYISEGAFCECVNLSKAILPSTLTQLGDMKNRFHTCFEKYGAFQNTAMTEVILPDEIKVIGEKSFADCSYLKSIFFPENLQIIGEDAFENCIRIEQLILPPKVKSIELGAFSNCQKLINLRLNEGLETIKGSAFSETPLTCIEIPKSVNNFGNGIFGSSINSRSLIKLSCYPGSKAVEYARQNNYIIVDASKRGN